jgi:hypothetical protein
MIDCLRSADNKACLVGVDFKRLEIHAHLAWFSKRFSGETVTLSNTDTTIVLSVPKEVAKAKQSIILLDKDFHRVKESH